MGSDLNRFQWANYFDRNGYSNLLEALLATKIKGRSNRKLGTLKGQFLHHVSLPVRNLKRSEFFYKSILRLRTLKRPKAFKFPGAWLGLGEAQQLHLVVNRDGTFRGKDQGVVPRDSHFAIHVATIADYFGTLEFLNKKGYYFRGDNSLHAHNLRPEPFGLLQSYLLDPDRHVVEITTTETAVNARSHDPMASAY
jgi:catechol 2,3-dioxygenase-like lactoylglutathione lyase family enzyme